MKITTTKRTSTTEMEQPTRTLVIFGATGDLCRRKLIPALETLDRKGLLPDNFKIIGASRSEHDRQSWMGVLVNTTKLSSLLNLTIIDVI